MTRQAPAFSHKGDSPATHYMSPSSTRIGPLDHAPLREPVSTFAEALMPYAESYAGFDARDEVLAPEWMTRDPEEDPWARHGIGRLDY